jgi:hypothetical protein
VQRDRRSGGGTLTTMLGHKTRQRVGDLRVTRWRDEVKQSVNPVVPEPWVSLDTRLLCEDTIILSFEVRRDLGKAEPVSIYSRTPTKAVNNMLGRRVITSRNTHQCSLSMPSPNPGVSTMVNAILTPSSSSSTLTGLIRMPSSRWAWVAACAMRDGSGEE